MSSAISNKPTVLISHSQHDGKLVAELAQEMRCYGWEPRGMELRNLPLDSNWRKSLHELVKRSSAFCFVVSGDFEKSAPCLAELTEVRRQRPDAPRVLVLIDIKMSRCVEAEIPVFLDQGLGGVPRRHVVDLAGRIDAVGRGLAPPVPAQKVRRDVAVTPDPLTSLLSQEDLRIRRHEPERALLARLRQVRVLAVHGMPSSGRSVLALDALSHLHEHEPDRLRMPLFIVATRECGGSVPDLRRLCAMVFDAVGPPPASAADEPAAALTALLDECEVWLFLDQFETATSEEGRCSDPELAKFLRIADETLERGRVILTAATPGIIMEGGRRCAHFPVPEWSVDELDRLAAHVASAMEALPPGRAALAELRRWASGNPYLLILALREWCATGSQPQVAREEVLPFQALSRFMSKIGSSPMTILQAFSLLSTFPVSERIVARIIGHVRGTGPLPGGDSTLTVAENLRQLVAAGLVQAHPGQSGTLYQLPGLVSAYLRDAGTPDTAMWSRLAESAATCILNERGNEGMDIALAGPAVHDGRTWLWPELSAADVSRAVRAADVFVNAGMAARAVTVLTSGREVLKRFNRIAPASVRRRFFDRVSTMIDLDIFSRHEALRALALALADAAEFTATMAVFDEAAELLLQLSHGTHRSRVRVLEAKNLDLKAYCLRQLGRVDESITTYERALKRLGKRLDPDERCKLLRGLANSYAMSRDWKQARAFFGEARSVATHLRAGRRRFNVGRIDCDLAILMMHQGEVAAAEAACRAGIDAMRECGDLWNQRIASLNCSGIELAKSGDITRQREIVQSDIPRLVQLESVVALRAARRIIEQLLCNPDLKSVSEWWVFVELT